MFSKTPKSLNAINVIFCAFVNHVLGMFYGVMFAQALQRVVAPEFVRVVYRSLPGFLSDNVHQFVSRNTLNDPRVDSAIALQKPKYNAFALGATTPSSFASAAKVALIHFYLAREFAAFQLRRVIDHFSQALVDSCYRLIIHMKIMCQFVRRLRLVEALYNAKLPTKLQE